MAKHQDQLEQACTKEFNNYNILGVIDKLDCTYCLAVCILHLKLGIPKRYQTRKGQYLEELLHLHKHLLITCLYLGEIPELLEQLVVVQVPMPGLKQVYPDLHKN